MYFCFFSECIQKRNFLYIFLFIYLHSISCSIISQKSIFRLVTGTTDTFLIIAPSAGCSSHPNCIAICIQFSIGIFPDFDRFQKNSRRRNSGGSVCQKRIELCKKRRFSCIRKSPRQSFAVRRRRNKVKFPKFRGHVPRNFAFSACKRASAASALRQAASPRENACIFENA